jgi:predicted  nucleic acid-binding Zn-ribbon protein
MSLSQLEQTLLDALNAQEIELQSAHDRMNSMQQQIDQLAESLTQSVSWQSELISRLNGLENLFEKHYRK